MKKNLTLLKLQIKAAFLSLPKILLGSLGMTVLVVLVSLGLHFAMQSADHQDKMAVAIVYPQEDNNYVKLAFNIISEIDTVKTVCTFENTDRESAYRGLKDGKYTAAVIIPEGFIHDIMVGINTPAEVIFSGKGVNNTSMIFREMLNAGAADLSSAEAGVYSVDDLFSTLLRNEREHIEEVEYELNEIYFSYALDRAIYFKVTDLSEKDGLSTIQYYVCTAILLLFLMSGISCASLLKRDNSAISIALKREGVHAGALGAYKVAGITLVFFVLGFTVLLISMMASVRFPEIQNIIAISAPLEFVGAVIGLFVLIYSVFSFIYFIFRCVGNPVYAVLVLFFAGTVMMFASGCFIPSSLLPSAVRIVGEYLPTAWYFRLVGQIIKGNVTVLTVLMNILFDVLFIGLAALAEKYQRNS